MLTEWEKIQGNADASESDPSDTGGCAEYDAINIGDLDAEVIIYTVVYKRIAVRQEPSLDGKVLNMAEKGDKLRTFGWDETGKWRKIHFKLPGGSGKLVPAWALVKHDQLGPLLQPVGNNTPLQEQTADAQPSHFGIALRDSESPVYLLNSDELRLAAREAPSSPSRGGRQQKDGWTDFMGKLGKGKKDAEESDGEEEQPNGQFAFVSQEEADQLVQSGAELYEVVIRPSIAIYAKPTKESTMIGNILVGLRLDTFAWDESQLWRKVCCQLRPSGKLLTGWVRVTHDEGFELLKRVTD